MDSTTQKKKQISQRMDCTTARLLVIECENALEMSVGVITMRQSRPVVWLLFCLSQPQRSVLSNAPQTCMCAVHTVIMLLYVRIVTANTRFIHGLSLARTKTVLFTRCTFQIHGDSFNKMTNKVA